MYEWIPLANFLVQCAVLGALIWYTRETLKIRRASQEQAESLQKPWLTLLTEAREYDDAVLEMDGTVGGMIVAAREGNVAVQNMGNGPAVNIRYEFEPLDPPQGVNVARPSGYLQNIPSNGSFVMQLAREVLRNFDYMFICHYESLSGNKYESRITLSNLVLTASHFRRN